MLITEGLGAAAPTLKRVVSAFRRDDVFALLAGVPVLTRQREAEEERA